MRRRRVLATLAGGLALLSAGCTDQSFERPSRVEVRNETGVRRAVSVDVSVNGDSHFVETLSVAPHGSVAVDRTFPGPGLFFATHYSLTAALETGETESASTSVTGRGGFDVFRVSVTADDGFWIQFGDYG